MSGNSDDDHGPEGQGLVLSAEPVRPGTAWRRRVRRAGTSRMEIRMSREAAFRRTLRIVVTLLALTGCAIEPPRPDGERIPPGVAAPTPVPAPIISRFGDWGGHGGVPRLWQHSGIDIRAKIGTPVLAAADGTVIRIGQQVMAGKFITVQHDVDLATAYYHLSAISVKVGQAVARGERLGRSGMTGNATAPHLHFGVCRREDGQCGESIKAGWDDPERYWVAKNPCLVSGESYAIEPIRFTYPLPCSE